MSKVKVTCVTCPKCGDTIYSRARHDYRSCSCDSVFIDGGFDYVRMGWHPELGEEPKVFNKFIMNCSRKDMYNDWNFNINKYGKLD